MGLIIAELLKLLGEQVTEIALLQLIIGAVTAVNKSIANVAATLANLVLFVETDATSGLPKIAADVAQILLDIVVTEDTVGRIEADYQQRGVAVTLPVDLPPTWATSLGGSIAANVWSFLLEADGGRAGDLLAATGRAAINDGGMFATREQSPSVGWLVSGDWANPESAPLINLGNVDMTHILSTDTSMLDLVQRDLGIGDYLDSIGRAVFVDQRSNVDWIYSTLWDQLDFDAAKARLFPTAPAVGAPVWPGLANVTFGTPVPIDVGVTVDGPMQGVVIAVTLVPQPRIGFDFNGRESWRGLGALAFVSDDGDAELNQQIGFEHTVYCPKAMASAAHAILRFTPGVEGTVTPWIVT